jgi:protein-S-isoprenylcysteine O-methyltransferase Ste14
MAHAALPRAKSSLMPRIGWKDGRPGIWNLFGLIPIVFAAAGLFWIVTLHITHIPARMKLEWAPSYLLRRGPYAFTRNPMYLAELALWLGWAIFYGSLRVLVGAGLWAAAMNFLIAPREERALEARFDEEYRHYKERVPRWL